MQSAGLTIRNTSESSVSYELRLPRTCEAVEIRIGGVLVGRYDIQAPSTHVPFQVDLTKKAGGR